MNHGTGHIGHSQLTIDSPDSLNSLDLSDSWKSLDSLNLPDSMDSPDALDLQYSLNSLHACMTVSNVSSAMSLTKTNSTSLMSMSARSRVYLQFAISNSWDACFLEVL